MSNSSRILCPVSSIDLTVERLSVQLYRTFNVKILAHFDVGFPKGLCTLFNDKLQYARHSHKYELT